MTARRVLRALVVALASAHFASAQAISVAPPEPIAADVYSPGRALITELDRIVTPRGVQESLVATLGGARQVVSVRGADRRNPILLYIHGGPGSVELPISWSFQRPWEDLFTVVEWDQRGAGRSLAVEDAKAIAPTLTPARYRDDAIALIEALRVRYGKRSVFLLGHSWGSFVGLSVAAARPDLLYAYVGMGQLIDFRANEATSYALVREQARRAGDAQAVAELDATSAASRPNTAPPTARPGTTAARCR